MSAQPSPADSEPVASPATPPGLPGALASGPFRALVELARLRAAGQTDEAVAHAERVLADARQAPPDAPLMVRVQLVLALADLYVDSGRRDTARSLLLGEAQAAERISQALRQAGTPDRARAAAAAQVQLRDRAVQIDLLGRPAPELDVADWVLGHPTTLAAERGRVVLLEFWATWCRPCLDAFPTLQRLHETYAARGLTVLAVTRYADVPAGDDVDHAHARERETIKSVVDERGLSVAVGVAPDCGLQRRYGASGVPTLAVIDRRGLVRTIAAGGDEDALEAMLTACLDEPDPGASDALPA